MSVSRIASRWRALLCVLVMALVSTKWRLWDRRSVGRDEEAGTVVASCVVSAGGFEADATFSESAVAIKFGEEGSLAERTTGPIGFGFRFESGLAAGFEITAACFAAFSDRKSVV